MYTLLCKCDCASIVTQHWDWYEGLLDVIKFIGCLRLFRYPIHFYLWLDMRVYLVSILQQGPYWFYLFVVVDFTINTQQFKVAPLSNIGSKFLTQRSLEIFILVLLMILLTLSRPRALVFPYGFPPIFSARVTFSLWPSILLRHVLLSWLMYTQCPWVQHYPPMSRTCFLFTHLWFAWPCLSTGIPEPLLYPMFACCSCWV